jgi:eukaryotic-like serine/threonine-protein kinase
VSAPARFGRYRVVRRIGSGAFATVWLAEDEELESPVAVKVLADNWAARLDVRARFEEEARILRRADSDRVVRVHDIGELEDGRPYFVMTYADRGTLASRLEDGPLPVPEALRYGADIARGLAVLHQVGVIHRDVNPGNVLLRSGSDGSERVLIADLGLAKAAARGSGFTLTVGTPGYTAPEQAHPGDVPLDRRADVYSIGAVLHHMLTGVAPKQDVPPPPVRSLVPSVPAAVEAVVSQALAYDPADRFPSAGALADALDAVAVRGLTPVRPDREDNERLFDPDPADVAQDTLRISRPRGRRRRRWLLPLLLVLVVLAGGLSALYLRTRDVAVSTADGAVSLRVPRSWAGQQQRSTWDLTPYGGIVAGAAVTVSPDVAAWRSGRARGVFAGKAPGVPPAAILARSVSASCPAAGAARTLTSGALTGTLTVRDCPEATYLEAVLQPPDRSYTVYVQITRSGTADTGESILRTLHVG